MKPPTSNSSRSLLLSFLAILLFLPFNFPSSRIFGREHFLLQVLRGFVRQDGQTVHLGADRSEFSPAKDKEGKVCCEEVEKCGQAKYIACET